ncbi:MAG: VWA domain-containing protein [Elusimicrobia bacterium]|nr:VWA domain-containing protein [Elusimicrobiota bacterium]
MTMRKSMAMAAAMLLLGSPVLAADSLKKLARKLEKGLAGDAARKVAILSFPYPDKTNSSGSTVVQERLTTFLAEGGKIQVVERQLLQKILEERKLAQTGLLDAKTSQELGQVLGVGALVTGTLNDVGRGLTEVNARAIDAATGRILSAGQAEVARTWDAPGATVLAKDSKVLPRRGRSLAQLAILLDTSGSMDGLIAQAKTQLWRIVNEVAAAKKDGDSPAIQVALYEYGNDGLSMRENYVRQVTGFTTDLDSVSERLFALRTNGGSEFTGAAIQDAVGRLEWSRDAGVYKAIFIAGNEPFAQGPVPFREAIASAVRRGVVVNTVYCGSREEGVQTDWLSGAQAGGGEYLVIDHDARVALRSAPQDDEITRLSYKLNSTVIPMGRHGAESAKRAAEQDANASLFAGTGAMVERALFKAKPQYARGAASWDAVSAAAAGAPVAEMKAEDLPAPLQGMSVEERKRHIEAEGAKRKEIQAKLDALQSERERYLKRQEQGGTAGSATFGQAMIDAVRKQASKKGYTFKS